MKITLKEIAKLAGVSPAAVSFALNNLPGVSEEKRAEIFTIAKKHGYISDEHKNNKTIRLVIFKREGYMISLTQFFSAIIEGIEKECREAGFELIISHMTRDLEEFNMMEEADKTAGWLVIATEMETEDIEYYSRIKKKIVFLDSCFNEYNLDYVLINNYSALSQGIKYLMQNGHKDIGYLDCTYFTNNFAERRQAFYSVMEKNELSVNEGFVFKLGPTTEDAYRDMFRILSPKPGLPTAFIAGNDVIACGAIKALQDNGISVPGGISVVGFDDYPFCDIITPNLTTMRVYKQELGSIAVKRLVQKIYFDDPIRLKIEANVELIKRNSVIKID